jgi:hypothetical protein
MNLRQIGGAVCALVATTVLTAAQDKPMPMDKKMEKTLTGCVMRSDSGIFTLDHAMAADTMKKDSMKKDSMAKDTMMKDSMAMTPELSSKNVDLSKHVGHRVSVTGSDDSMNGKTTFAVKSLKMVASSCS